MFGRQLNQRNSTYPEVSSMSTKDCNSRNDYINIVLKHFWKRFSDTYLNELKQRHLYNRAKSADATLKINDVVLVRDDTPKPRTQWKIGKVEELIIGRDGKLRGARLKVNTKHGTSLIHRPVQKLIPFEIAADDEPLTADLSTDKIDNPVDFQQNSGGAPSERLVEGQNLRKARDFS